MVNVYQYTQIAKESKENPYDLFRKRIIETREMLRRASDLEQKAKTNRNA